MSGPRVSIVIPAYNAGRYLRAAIDSVLAQDHPDVETIVVDDGSTDDTAAIGASYGDRIRFVSQPNAGQADALNRGWSVSSGSILAYLSADDLLKPNAVSRSLEVFAQKPNAIVTYCDYELISSESAVLRRVYAPEFDYQALVQRGVVAPGPGAFFRREVFAAVGGWNPAYRQVPDYDFWLRMGLHGEFVHIPEVLASFRVHPESASFAKPAEASADEPIAVADRFFESHPCDAVAEHRGRSAARVLAARAHLRSGRYVTAFRRLREAWHFAPSAVLNRGAIHMLLSGIIGRARYMIWWRVLHATRRRDS